MSNIFDELDELARELGQIMPPPRAPQGLRIPDGSVGSWFIDNVWPGYYALRAQYVTPDGDVVVGEPDRKLVGQPQALLMALGFAVNLAKVNRYEWHRC